jgi:hypothetical protein
MMENPMVKKAGRVKRIVNLTNRKRVLARPTATARKAPIANRTDFRGLETTARVGSKLSGLVSMLQRSGGATIDQMCQSTGWQSHSVRGALAGAIKEKLGLKIESEKLNGIRTYRIVT